MRVVETLRRKPLPAGRRRVASVTVISSLYEVSGGVRVWARQGRATSISAPNQQTSLSMDMKPHTELPTQSVFSLRREPGARWIIVELFGGTYQVSNSLYDGAEFGSANRLGSCSHR
jgi:hypothetical protein